MGRAFLLGELDTGDALPNLRSLSVPLPSGTSGGGPPNKIDSADDAASDEVVFVRIV